jgi:hypothetical protein
VPHVARFIPEMQGIQGQCRRTGSGFYPYFRCIETHGNYVICEGQRKITSARTTTWVWRKTNGD